MRADAETPRCLDVSRLISRVGYGPPTGIDRVEAAYLRELLARRDPLWLLARVRGGHMLLDRPGAREIAQRLTGDVPWGPRDLAARFSRTLGPARLAAEADLRRFAFARSYGPRPKRLLARHLPPGCTYLNVGHSNLTDAVLNSVGKVADGRIAVMVHDMIPLDFPLCQRPGEPERFAAKMRRVGARADLVIYNSAETRRCAEAHFKGWGRVPPGVTAHIGLDLERRAATELPPGTDPDHPRFVTIGTIEPRKNHALLLDVWEMLAAQDAPGAVPHLHIVGRRGWNNDAVFRRLDTAPCMGKTVFEHNDLDDGALAALLSGSRALLFASIAEGFGLPLIEAAAAGVPVICGENAICREVLGDYPVYLDTSDAYSWATTIRERAAREQETDAVEKQRKSAVRIPRWAEHFQTTLAAI